jgi:acyl-CoA synthetase (AMP-forming)/AMP-acid ligase II
MLLTAFIEFHAQARPDSPMLIQDAQTLSFAQAIKRGRGIAGWLQRQGFGQGDRLAVLGENSIDHLLLLLGASYIGAVLVPLNYRLAAAELADVIADAEAKLLLVSDPAMVTLKTELLPLLNGSTVVAEALGDAELKALPNQGHDDDILIQLYTSGTTGRPKGVQISHRNVAALAVSSWMMYREKVGVGSTDLVVAPLFHIGGLGSVLIPIMAGGAVLLHRQFEPLKIVDDIERCGVNTLFLVPAMIQAVLSTVPDIRQRDFSSLKQMTYGASPISPSLLSEAIAVFDCHFYQLYGMTETTGAVIALLPEDHQRAMVDQPELLQSCGRAIAGVQVKICDSDGRSVASGETGEIVIRSDTNTRGYWQRAEETHKAIKDGWVYTGDAGIMDEEGFIYIRDRLKDMVVTGGENVYPVEVEKVIAGHPAVLEAAVIGVPDQKYGEALMAVCVLNPGCQLTADELVDFCRDQIAGYKIPRQLSLVEALPRNPSGKILKTVLRQPYWKDQLRQV